MSTAALPLHAFPGTPPFARPPRLRFGLVLIAAAHAVAVWLFLQADLVAQAVQQATPLMVALLSEPAPLRPPEPGLNMPQPQRQALPPPTLMPPPEVKVAEAAPPAPPPVPPEPMITSVVPAPAPATPAVAALAEPQPVRALPTQPPTVTAPPLLPASAIRYRVPPPIEVPLASRRLRESVV